jgi:UDP-N-acetylglucosamine 1-carboxyvinyltransferase
MNQQFKIKGKAVLKGEIKVNGAKNAALKILAASVLSEQACLIKNFPFIEDTKRMLELLESLGAKVEKDLEGQQVRILPVGIKMGNLQEELTRKLRASVLLAGPLLARFGKVTMTHPGGCVIGKRPIDMFLEGFLALGAEIIEEEGRFILKIKKGKKRLMGGCYFFPRISVTGTETLMITAVLAKGKSVLENCAMEPEIPLLA